MSAVLKLVQAEAFSEELQLPTEGGARSSHSIQEAFKYCSPWKASLAQYVIERFSKKGAVVLDPMCSTGIVGVEASLLGRHFIGVAQDHGMVKLARARLLPADLAEVALRLQFVPFKRPVDIRGFAGPFPHFFDSDTYRELINLKTVLRDSRDNVSEFVMFIVASILHGHTTGHISVYSSPSEGLSPEAQAALNRKRGEQPSYRAVGARVLKKAAVLMRDGMSAALEGGDRARREVFYGETNNLERVQTSSVDLAMIAPNQPGFFEHGMHSWLRTWWLGVDVPAAPTMPASVNEWRDLTNEMLIEMARVVRPGGRAVVRMGQGRLGSKAVNYTREFQEMAASCLQSFWRIEGAISERYVETSKSQSGRRLNIASDLIVLRRR